MSLIRVLLFLVLLGSVTLAAVGNLNIAKDPTKTYQTTAGFGTYFSDSSFFCSSFKNLGSSTGMYFAINGIVGYPSNDFSSKYCGKCIAVQTSSGQVLAPVQLIDVCDPSNCDYSDGGHLDFLDNNGNKLYNAVAKSPDTYQGNPKFTWWWLPSCTSNPQLSQPTPPTSQQQAPIPLPKSPTPSAPKSSPVRAPSVCQDPNACVSQWGYCGYTDSYCGAGCKGGPCKGSPVPVPVSVPVPISKIQTPTPKSPTPAPKAPTPAPKAPTPVPVSQQTPSSQNTGCGAWQTGTMSGYDNLDGADDAHPGCLAEYCGTTAAFLNAVPVSSILARDFPNYKYHNVEINWNGKIGTVQAWDECANADCPNGETTCCTDNAKLYGGDFLLDVDRHALQNVFGIANYGNVLDKISYRICAAADVKSIASKWLTAGRQTDTQADSGTSLPGWAWGVIAVGIVLGLLFVVAGVVFFMKRKPSTEHV